jgi:vancomycin permeability regulator SanA
LLAYIFAICGLLLNSAVSGLHKAEYAVVLGNQVLVSGQPSKRLVARLDKAIEIYNNNKVLAIIVSGGFGKEGFDEATVMKKYLIQHRIPVNKIITDSNGNNTYLTAENTKNLIGTNTSIIVVSQLYHLARCNLQIASIIAD